MDAERPIEKLLRTTAQKRAEDAGEPLSPHPATRRMLQGEVARVYGLPQTGPERADGASLLGRLWPGLGWSFAMLIGLALAGLLMLPHRKAQNFEMAMASKPAEALRPSESAAAVANESAARKQVLSDESRVDRKPAANRPSAEPQPLLAYDDTVPKAKLESTDAGAAKDRLLREEISTASPAAAPPVAASGAPRSKNDTDALAALGTAQSAPASTLSLAASAPAPSGAPKRAIVESESKTATFGGAETPRTDAGTRFVQAPAVAGALLDKATPPILASFRFEQTGSQVRIVDADGSVYNGSIKPSTLNEKNESGINAPSLNRMYKALPAAPMQAAQAEPLAGASFSFQAEGTNQTLKQKVSLSGELYTASGEDLKKAITNAVTETDTLAKKPAARDAMNGSRISGKAALGDAVYQINALSAP